MYLNTRVNLVAVALLAIIAAPAGALAAHEDLKIIAGDGGAEHEFGNAVAIDQGVIAVGARFDDDNGTNSGSAYLFNASIMPGRMGRLHRAREGFRGRSDALRVFRDPVAEGPCRLPASCALWYPLGGLVGRVLSSGGHAEEGDGWREPPGRHRHRGHPGS